MVAKTCDLLAWISQKKDGKTQHYFLSKTLARQFDLLSRLNVTTAKFCSRKFPFAVVLRNYDGKILLTQFLVSSEDWSDEGIRMVFPFIMVSFDVVSSLKVCLYGARSCWSCLVLYLFTMDCDSACMRGSFYIACCISLMVKAIGRQICMMASMTFSVSCSKVLISLCMLLVCLER